jgi:hypothetical protein
MSNRDCLFCTATTRPSFCFFNTNLCCFNCKKNSECQVKNYNNKVKPCTFNELDGDEICPYMI